MNISNHQAAISYIKRGWRVLPVNQHKIPLIKRWPELASTDPTQIAEWWKRFPDANVGIATGPESGIWVVDIDVKNGVDGWQSLQAEFEDFTFCQNHLTATSPTGGTHLYYKWNPSIPVTVSANVLPGVDIRGERGFVLAAPSAVVISGESRHYQFNNFEYAIAQPPPWAVSLANLTLNSCTTQTPGARTFDVKEVMTGIHSGGRDDAIYRYACHLRGCDIPLDLAQGFVLEAAARCIPPFDTAIALAKIKRVYSIPQSNGPLFSLRHGG